MLEFTLYKICTCVLLKTRSVQKLSRRTPKFLRAVSTPKAATLGRRVRAAAGPPVARKLDWFVELLFRSMDCNKRSFLQVVATHPPAGRGITSLPFRD